MSYINTIELKLNKKYPGYFKSIKENFVDNKDFQWSEFCYIPIAGPIAVISEGEMLSIFEQLEIINDAALMAGLCGWKVNNKKVIAIEEVKKRHLWNNSHEILDINTKDIFDKIGYGTYLDCELDFKDLLNTKYVGALLHMEYDVNLDRLELRAALVPEDENKNINPMSLHLIEGNTLFENICDTLNFTKQQVELFKKEKITNIDTVNMSRLLNDSSMYAYYVHYLVFSTLLELINDHL